MMNPVVLRYALFFLIVYLLALLASFPAEQAYRMARQLGPLPVELYGIDGTSWRGRAQTVRIDDVSLRDFEWTLRPLPLLIGRAEARIALRIGEGTLTGITGRTLGGASYARDVRIDAALADLGAVAGFGDLGLRGRLHGDFERLRVGNREVQAMKGTLAIADGGIGEPLNMIFGSFVADIETRDEGIHAALRDREGPLRAEGALTLQPAGEWRLRLRLAPRDPADARTRDMLRSLGRPGAEGQIELTRNGALPLDRIIP